MKIKTIITSVIAGASLLAFVGAASAATTYSNGGTSPATPQADLNIYGASAQFTFWKREFPNFLTAAGCVLGLSGTSADGNHFIQQANCSPTGPALVTFRVSSKASYDGPLAVDSSTNVNADLSCNAGGFGGLNTRPMIDPATCAAGVCATPTASATTCVPVTIGASDVLVSDFQQVSKGALHGPAGGTATTRDFKANPVVLDANVTDYCRPLAIPFAFFINKSVVQSDGTTTMTNISTAEAKMIFSGLIKNWADLEATSMLSQPLSLCYRHAGSGTHASMDAFMRPVTMLQNALTVGTSRVYFNDSTGDMMNCLNGTGTWTGAGTIGYADADRDISSKPNVVRIALDGNQPVTANIDDYTWSFDTIQNMYALVSDVNGPAAVTPLLADICTYAAQPSTTAANNPYWSATCNMKHIKNSNFQNFISNLVPGPTSYHNANCN